MSAKPTAKDSVKETKNFLSRDAESCNIDDLGGDLAWHISWEMKFVVDEDEMHECVETVELYMKSKP